MKKLLWIKDMMTTKKPEVCRGAARNGLLCTAQESSIAARQAERVVVRGAPLHQNKSEQGRTSDDNLV